MHYSSLICWAVPCHAGKQVCNNGKGSHDVTTCGLVFQVHEEAVIWLRVSQMGVTIHSHCMFIYVFAQFIGPAYDCYALTFVFVHICISKLSLVTVKTVNSKVTNIYWLVGC